MKICDKQTIAAYKNAIGEAREGAALYCKTCDARLVYRNGTWKKENAK